MASVQAVLNSTYVSQNVAKSMPCLTSQLCGDPCWLSAYPGKMGSFIEHLDTLECQRG